MKLRLFTTLILTVWFAGFAFKGTAQPNWELNPQDYEFSMTITGKVNTDGFFSDDENDMVAAFANGKCRGFAKSIYESFENGYFVYMMVYSNSPFEKITFKIFDASENEVVETSDSANFIINNIMGSIDSPFIFSSSQLSNEAKMISFEILRQVGETSIEGNSINLKGSSTLTLTKIAADFSISEGATVFVNGIGQESNVTTNDFSSPVEYVIVSASLTDTTLYTVNIVLDENDPPTAINLSNVLISESAELNTIVATIEVVDQDLFDTHHFSLITGNGVNDAQNNLFKIVDDNLILVQPLNFKDKQVLSVLIRATDNAGAPHEESLVLQVTNENDPPKFSSTPLTYVFQGDIYVYPMIVIDSDDDPVQIVFENLPDWLTYSSNSKLFTGVPGNEDVGDYKFKIVASDGKMESVQIVAFTVINVNDPPEINKYIANQLFHSNSYNEIQLPIDCIVDKDKGDELTFNLTTDNNSAMPEWLDFNQETLIISGHPPQGIYAAYNLKLTATDGGGLKEFLLFRLEVSFPTAIDDQTKSIGFRVFPNPVQSSLYIDVPVGEDARVSISNLAGQTVKTFHLSPGLAREIPMNGIESGIYIVRFRQGEIEKIQKIIKQ
ncbi:MAG: putative Ig domain-containing protein [Bacteroidales bacterium]|nr:putative Ig domain-containing protein [Bacteroidales bacterium]